MKLNDPYKCLANADMLRRAAQSGDMAKLKFYNQEAAPFERNDALHIAAKYGQTQCVKFLIPISDTTSGEHRALQNAFEGNHSECVELLIMHGHFHQHVRGVTKKAAQAGHASFVRQMLHEHAFPANDLIEITSSVAGSLTTPSHVECLHALLDATKDKKVLAYIVLLQSLYQKKQQIFNEVYPLTEVDVSELTTNPTQVQELQDTFYHMRAEYENNLLSKSVSEGASSKTKKM